MSYVHVGKGINNIPWQYINYFEGRIKNTLIKLIVVIINQTATLKDKDWKHNVWITESL